MKVNSQEFERMSREALGDTTLQGALDQVRRLMPGIRSQAMAELADYEAMTARARDIRADSIANMENYLAAFSDRVRARGGRVHRARDGAEARRIVADLCAGADAVIKSKSMVTEEIELNASLEDQGIRVTETDLGEYIIQLRGERPSHILAPSLHVTLKQVTSLFQAHHDVVRDGPPESAEALLAEARQVLREIFLNADVGITGANFLVAETGAAVVVTNEGNADLTACLPDKHIVVTGIEKVVPTLDDVSVLLRLLARSAVGERLSNYTTFFHGPAREPGDSGPSQYHVILVDNGRSALVGSDYQEILHCIRCSACINHCPVYAAVGGHAYGSVYSGPMGAVWTPALAGLEAAAKLPQASSFCGRCEEVCPVRIPLPRLLRYLRRDAYREGLTPRPERRGLAAWRWLNRRPWLYRWVLGFAAMMLRGRSWPGAGPRDRWVRTLPGFGGNWTQDRDLLAPEGGTFQSRWRAQRFASGDWE